MKKCLSVAFLGLLFLSPIQANAQPIKMFKEAPFEFYKVTRGDSFWFIGKRYGLDYKELMRLNPSVDPRNMQIGSNIRLKGSEESQKVGDFEAQVAALVNQERAKVGLQPLKHRADIANVAEVKAKDMVNRNYFSHQSPTYGSPFDMLKRFNISYRAAGENIAQGQRSPKEVMNSWMNSSGHRANILNTNYNAIGVGYYNGSWVQMFIQSN